MENTNKTNNPLITDKIYIDLNVFGRVRVRYYIALATRAPSVKDNLEFVSTREYVLTKKKARGVPTHTNPKKVMQTTEIIHGKLQLKGGNGLAQKGN
uniref:Uncharacterized protein n=1 Tax=Oryza glaberrima TaxID=4538 RepID=I1Q9V8_ORYGL